MRSVYEWFQDKSPDSHLLITSTDSVPSSLESGIYSDVLEVALSTKRAWQTHPRGWGPYQPADWWISLGDLS